MRSKGVPTNDPTSPANAPARGGARWSLDLLSSNPTKITVFMVRLLSMGGRKPRVNARAPSRLNMDRAVPRVVRAEEEAAEAKCEAAAV
jgi:hypothetical protein